MKVCWCDDFVIFIVAGLLVFTHVVIQSRSRWRKYRAADNLAQLRLFRQRAANYFAAAWNKPKTISFLDNLVTQRMELRRVGWANSSYNTGANILSLVMATAMWNIIVDRPRWQTTGQTVAVLVGLSVFLFACIFPSFTKRLVDVYYGLYMILIACFLAWSHPDYFLFGSSAAFIIRLSLSLLHLKMTQVIFWNLVCVCTSCVYVWQDSSGSRSVPNSMYYMYELGMSACLVLAVLGFRHSTLNAVRQEINAMHLKIENSASMSLLDMVCDVVVELSNDLTMEHDSRELAALLMRSSGNPITSLPFCDFILNDSERENFRNKILATSSDDSVGTCRVTLSDSLCNHVRVETFFVRVCISEEQECRYLLGIREFSDEMPSMQSFESRTARSKTTRRMERKGTPSSLEYVSLEAGHTSPVAQGNLADVISSKDTPGSPVTKGEQADVAKSKEKSEQLHFAHLAATSLEAQSASMLLCMTQWNVKVPRTVCCSFHAYVMDAKAALRLLSQRQCVTNFPLRPPSGLQCQECGLFSEDYTGEDDELLACKLCQSQKVIAVGGEHGEFGNPAAEL